MDLMTKDTSKKGVKLPASVEKVVKKILEEIWTMALKEAITKVATDL